MGYVYTPYLHPPRYVYIPKEHTVLQVMISTSVGREALKKTESKVREYYNYYYVGTPEELARAHFEERHGCQPAEVFVTKVALVLGPVPARRPPEEEGCVKNGRIKPTCI